MGHFLNKNWYKKKIVIFFIPVILIGLILIILDNIHPKTFGSIQVTGGNNLSIKLRESIRFENSINIKNLTFNNVKLSFEDVVLNGDSIDYLLIDTGNTGSIELLDNNAYDLVFSETKPNGKLNYGFNIQFYPAIDKICEIQFKSVIKYNSPLIYFTKNKTLNKNLKLNIVNCQIYKNNEKLPIIKKDLKLAIKSFDDSNFKIFEGLENGTTFLKINYILIDDSSSIIFKETPPLGSISMDSSICDISKGEINVFTKGEILGTYKYIPFKLISSNNKIIGNLNVNNSGLLYNVIGVFEELELIIGNDKKTVLPSALEDLNNIVTIIIAAIAIIIDKLITIYTFFTSKD